MLGSLSAVKKVSSVFSYNISIQHTLQHENLHVKQFSKMVQDISFQMADFDRNDTIYNATR